MDPERRDDIYFVPGFVRFLFWLKRPAQVRPKEIEILKKWLQDFAPEALEVAPFTKRQRVSVQSGLLMGHHGEVVEKRGTSLELILEELQLKIKVDLSMTEVALQA